MDAVPVPRAVRDGGCWNPGKLEVDETQELRDKLSEVVKADPGRRNSSLPWKLHFSVQTKTFMTCKDRFIFLIYNRSAI